jgi:hypothetical protein
MARWILALAFAIFTIPRLGAAGVLTIDFDLGRSVVVGPTDSSPVRSGLVTLSLTGVDENGMWIDPMPTATLMGFRLGLNPITVVDLTATIDFVQQGAVTLPLSNGGFFDLPVGALTGEVQVRGQRAGMPVSSNFPFTDSGNVTRFSIAGLENASTLSSNGLLRLVSSPAIATFQINGVELRRRFVPEPDAAGLWVLALVAFLSRRNLRTAHTSMRHSSECSGAGS